MRFWAQGLTTLILSVTATVTAASAQGGLQSGYTVLMPAAGTAAPAGAVLFSYSSSNGVLVSQAAVGASEPMRSGRVFVDDRGTDTGIALVNPSAEDASVTLVLRDASGAEVEPRTTIPLAARQHLARFVSELFANRPNGTGSLTFESTTALSAIALRRALNADGESLFTTLPVVDLNAPPGNQRIVFPHIAVGGGYSTQILLVNRSSQTMTGRVDFIASDGRPMLVRTETNTIANVAYEIQPHGTYRTEVTGDANVAVGYALVTANSGSNTPSGTAIFRLRSGNALLSEAGVAAIAPTVAARIYVDYIGTRTGVALANPGDQPADVTFTLMDRFGFTEQTVQRRLPAGNHTAQLVGELFPIAEDYSGLLEVSSTTPVVPIALKLTTNARNNLVLTTLPIADLAAPAAAGSVVFPHIVIGGGFSTRLILINTGTSTAARGEMAFYHSSGTSLAVPLRGETASRFGYEIVAGGGRQLYPGNTAQVARVSLIDNELVINEGNRVHPSLRIVDSTNAGRDDFDAAIMSLDTSVAEVDAFGSVLGKKAGFSTLKITAGGIDLFVTATVVGVNSGGAGYRPVSVIQDPAGRLYTASATEHVVFRADNLSQAPQRYAGTSNIAGFENAERLQARFNRPSFLAKNQGTDKTLFVSDGANNAIRRVGDAPDGRVDTLAGGLAAGSANGPVGSASFNNPRGLALDSRGYLWVADSGNHTIRRINLVSLTVETIAGRAGVPGSADGRGPEALFNSPSGIAVEVETPVQELQRAIRRDGPAPVSIIVADTGNGLVRRVKENGEVETIPGGGSSALSGIAADKFSVVSTATAAPAAMFVAPFAVAVDATGNIFVTDQGSVTVKTILRSGGVVPAAQPGTLSKAGGIAVAKNGKVVVAGEDQGAIELTYGQPNITSVAPAQWSNKGGQRVTIRGRNFAPDTLVVVAGVLINDRLIADTQTITFTTPVVPSGRQTVTIFNRGGTYQTPVTVDPVPVREMPIGHVTTVAGGSTFAGEGAPATEVSAHPIGVAVDVQGNVFFSDVTNRKIRRVDVRTGILTTVAGNGQDGPEGDNGPAILAGLSYPGGIAFDPSGNLLIADGGIRQVNAVTGIITTIVSGEYGYCGDDGPAMRACFNYIVGIAVDAEGTIFIADRYNDAVRRVDGRSGTVTTVAGNGKNGFSGDDGLATAASLNEPFAVAVDNDQKLLYIADMGNHRVRRVDLRTNKITTVAGDSGGLTLENPVGLAVDSAGDVFITDRGHSRIRKLEIASGALRTVAGSDAIGSAGDGGPATSASLHDPYGLAVDAAGNVFIADYYALVVRRVDAVTGIITTFAGNRQWAIADDNGPAAAATLRQPVSVTADRSGNIYINDAGNGRVRKVDAATGTITTVAGGGSDNGDAGPATNAAVSPSGRIALDQDGNLYFAERWAYRIRKVDARTKAISTIAGNGTIGSSGDGGLALNAGVLPDDVGVDWNGNLYFAENETRRIRRVNLTTGVIETVVGAGGGLGRHLRIAVHPHGDLFIADLENRVVRKFDYTTGDVTTVAGGGTSYQDNRLATTVSLFPVAIDVDMAGNLYIPELYRILKVSQGGIITTVAGSRGMYFQLGDNGPAMDAFLYYPEAVAVDPSGNLFIADSQNSRIRVIRGPIP